MSLLLSAFPAAFFVANAANTDAVGTLSVSVLPQPTGGATEYVSITFSGTGVLNLDGWTIEDTQATAQTRHTFGASAILSGESVKVCGNSTGEPSCDFTIDFGGNSIWNNDGDTLNLKDETGALVVSISYTTGVNDTEETNSETIDYSIAPATINITNVAELRDAIENQAAGQTWTIQAGDYGMDRFSSITAGGPSSPQTGWYFPITENDITINGVGNPIIYGDEYSANGSLSSQNLITVFGDNVTITGLTLMPKIEANKTIEILGNDVTLEDIVITPNTKVANSVYTQTTNETFDRQWGGSIYFSHEGDHTLKNIVVNNSGISFRYAPSGTTINFDNVTIVNESNDDVTNGYRYSSGFNNSGNSTVGLPEVIYRVNATLDNVDSVFASAKDGDTVEFDSDITTTKEINVNTELTINGNGHTISPTFTKNSTPNDNSALQVNADNVTINGLIIDGVGGTNLHGINTYKIEDFELNNVTLLNNDYSGLVVNGSKVTVNDITTSGNGWHSINAANGVGVTDAVVLTMNNTSSHTEIAQIWVDDISQPVTIDDADNQYEISFEGPHPNPVYQTTARNYTLKSVPVVVDPNNENQLTITVYKFHNRNSDRDRDTGEEFLSGWEMRLYKEVTETEWNLIATGTTDVDGKKKFPQQQEAGRYLVCEVSQLGWTQVAPIGDTQTPNISPNASEEGPYCTSSGYSDESDRSTKPEIGNISNDLEDKNQLNISGEVYVDIAVDDCDNRTECLFSKTSDKLNGWEMRLYKEVTGIWTEVATSTTNSDGIYRFPTQYEAGVYHTCEVLENGYEQGIGNWNGSGYLVNTANLSGSAGEGPYCNTYTYADDSDKSSKSHFGNVKVENQIEYAAYCGDGEVNQVWEQCEADDEGGTCNLNTCQYENQCSELNLVKINLEESESVSFNDTLYLGSDTNPIPSGVWFNFDEAGDASAGSIANSVPGLGIERNQANQELYLAFKGGNGKGHLDQAYGTVDFMGVEVQQSAVNRTPNPQFKLENGSGGSFNDVFGVTSSSTINFDMRADTGNDGVTVGLEDVNVCEVPAVSSLEITNPATDGEELSGTYTFEADYQDYDDDEDVVYWAIRTGTCNGQDMVGNTPASPQHASSFATSTGEFMTTVDMSTWANGPYCLVVNPREDAGAPDVRDTRTFVLENSTDEDVDPQSDPVLGCTDETATNYNSLATDGNSESANCTYPQATTERSSGGSSSGNIPNARFGFATPAPTPQVLGATTINTCPFILSQMQLGAENEELEVMKLQAFLNIFKSVFGGVENPITGTFGSVTDANVKSFQEHFRSEILDPWYNLGIVPHNRPTGFVYKTTMWKINSMLCPENTELPSLAGEDLSSNVAIN